MNGWFVFAVTASIILCTGFVIAVSLLKAAWAQREREALTSSDLRALEESAVCLIDQLRTEADSALGELESRYARLGESVRAADERINMLRELEASRRNFRMPSESQSIPPDSSDPMRQQVLDLASNGVGCSQIAQQMGIDCAEVKLMLRLAGMQLN